MLTLTALANPPYAFTSWVGSGGSFADATLSSTTFNISGNATVTANFSSPPTATNTSTPAATATPTSTLTFTNTPAGTNTPTQTATPTPPVCTGDCDGSGDVTVNEIITLVNIALGSADISTCMAGDANKDGQITVDEILTAVNNALNGCPSS